MTGPKSRPQLFSEIQAIWYEKLERSGFEDIETPNDRDGALKEWHSFKFVSLKAQLRKEKLSAYQLQIDSFANDPAFPEILKLMTKHGHNKFDSLGLETIWTMHRQGMTERRIAFEQKVSQSCIHFLLKRMREWMRLV